MRRIERFFDDRPGPRNDAELSGPLLPLARRERDEHFVADEVVVGVRPRRRRVLDPHQPDLFEITQPIDQELRERAFARPFRRVNCGRHGEWPSGRPTPVDIRPG